MFARRTFSTVPRTKRMKKKTQSWAVPIDDELWFSVKKFLSFLFNHHAKHFSLDLLQFIYYGIETLKKKILTVFFFRCAHFHTYCLFKSPVYSNGFFFLQKTAENIIHKSSERWNGLLFICNTSNKKLFILKTKTGVQYWLQTTRDAQIVMSVRLFLVVTRAATHCVDSAYLQMQRCARQEVIMSHHHWN